MEGTGSALDGQVVAFGPSSIDRRHAAIDLEPLSLGWRFGSLSLLAQVTAKIAAHAGADSYTC